MPSLSLSRRDWLALAAGLAAANLPRPLRAGVNGRKADRRFLVTDVARTTAALPYRETPARNMARELPHWRYVEICEVTLNGGQRGFGETLLFYTWGAPTDEAVQRAVGGNAVELMWDDSLGAGLQMALFDAVARAAGVPCHALLGRQVHDKTPLSWWNIDTSAEDMAAECALAYREGYRAYKTKGRPWFDLDEQVTAAAKVVPSEFKIDMDFNETLLDAERAIPILQKQEAVPQVGLFESPIPQTDIAGNRKITEAVHVPIAFHYGKPDPLLAIREKCCDGFLDRAGAGEMMRTGAVCAAADVPFWLQLVGSDVTAAFSLHFGGVLSHATWPAVNCHQLYADRLLTGPIRVEEGYAKVPDAVGLGYELDRDVLEKHRVEKPPERPEPERLIEVSWPDGRRQYVANNGEVNFMLTLGQQGRIPFYEKGATTRLVPDDGSPAWKERYRRARKETFIEP